jgi:predicted metalloprotease with PDZ domain
MMRASMYPPRRRDILGLCASAAASAAAPVLVARQSRAAPALGTIEVDAREAPRRIIRARLTFPAAPGPFALVYPKWLPGEHAPVGPINDVTGIELTVAGKRIPWRRDDEDMFQIRAELPAGTKTLEVNLEYVTAAGGRGAGSPAVASARLLVLKWNHVLLYPRGADPRALMMTASVRLPEGWSQASALGIERKTADGARFAPVSLETLIDSPVAAGAHARTLDLGPPSGPPHALNLFADSPEALGIKPAVATAFQRLVLECGSLFGGWPYRRYHFLLSLSDHIPHGGLEHHQSSDNRIWERSLLDDAQWTVRSALLPHEIVHSWNGKHRRPAGLCTRDYQQPMKTDLLWVYEGLTTYLGNVLTARSGLRGQHEARDALAYTAASQDHRVGRSWRSLADTAVSAPELSGAVREWRSWRRGLDYYPESELIWLEADTLIRQRTEGKRSLDDFCQVFHGRTSKGTPSVLPYTLEDLLAALQGVCPLDWRQFFQARVYTTSARAPLGGIENGGWRLVYKESPSTFFRHSEQATKEMDFTFSLGLVMRDDGTIIDVAQASPAARAGMAPASRLVAVNGRRLTGDVMRAAVAATKTRPDLDLLVESSDYFRNHKVSYRGGNRYPTLERDGKRPDLLTAIYNPRAPVPPAAPPSPPSAPSR